MLQTLSLVAVPPELTVISVQKILNCCSHICQKRL